MWRNRYLLSAFLNITATDQQERLPHELPGLNNALLFSHDALGFDPRTQQRMTNSSAALSPKASYFNQITCVVIPSSICEFRDWTRWHITKKLCLEKDRKPSITLPINYIYLFIKLIHIAPLWRCPYATNPTYLYLCWPTCFSVNVLN